MKKIIAIALLAAVAAYGESVTGPNGERLDAWPTVIRAGNMTIVRPTRETAEAHGYHASTPEELAAWAEQDESANEQAALPQTFETGIAVPNGDHWYQLVPDGTNVVAQTIAVQVSQSPLTPEQHDAMLAAALSNRAAKVAAAIAGRYENNPIKRIERIERLLGIRE